MGETNTSSPNMGFQVSLLICLLHDFGRKERELESNDSKSGRRETEDGENRVEQWRNLNNYHLAGQQCHFELI